MLDVLEIRLMLIHDPPFLSISQKELGIVFAPGALNKAIHDFAAGKTLYGCV